MNEDTKAVLELMKSIVDDWNMRVTPNEDDLMGQLTSLYLTLHALMGQKKPDPGPCYRCHEWPCKCSEGPLLKKPE